MIAVGELKLGIGGGVKGRTLVISILTFIPELKDMNLQNVYVFFEIIRIFNSIKLLAMTSNYKKIFTGESIVAKQIASRLHEVGIEAVVKDEAESARLAGFASSMLGQVDIFVHKDEFEKALTVINEK